ncbi:class I SAM-dependent methyltransferase [Candidatus Pacearchaeota archaeon]|nr:class I SAM-dependent methyltransferase [Candidatus Pacearchaeota archaeon]
MKLIERKNSVLSGRNNMEQLVVLKDFPVFFGCTDSEPENDLFADMIWCIDRETGVIQLSKLVPLDILYQMQHVDGCGSVWENYYNSFASFISEQKPSNILEIGGGQGRLADLVTSKLPDSSWTIVEPNPTHSGSSSIKLISSFFDEGFGFKESLDTIVFSQVLEHAYDPQTFLDKIASLLPLGGKLIFAYPNLELWVRRKYTNALNFEHTMFLTDYHLDYLLAKNGFHIINKTSYIDHSIFYVVEKRTDNVEIQMPSSKFSEYKEIFMDFINHYTHTVKELNEKIKTVDSPIYLFGAHIFSQYLLSFGLNQTKIESILDNSKTKQGKRLYGTQFFVQSPDVLKEQDQPIVILKAGIYNEEIKKAIVDNINPNVIFWE